MKQKCCGAPLLLNLIVTPCVLRGGILTGETCTPVTCPCKQCSIHLSKRYPLILICRVWSTFINYLSLLSDVRHAVHNLFIHYLSCSVYYTYPTQRVAQFCVLANQRRSTSVCACQTAGNIICQPALLKGIAFRTAARDRYDTYLQLEIDGRRKFNHERLVIGLVDFWNWVKVFCTDNCKCGKFFVLVLVEHLCEVFKAHI